MVNVKLGKEMKKDEIIMSQTWDKEFFDSFLQKEVVMNHKICTFLAASTIIPQVRNAM